MKSFRKRIRNINKHLHFYLKEGEKFRVGLLFEDYSKSHLLNKYNLPKTFIDNSSKTPLAKGSVTRANVKGKYGRKQPEEKETITRHIDFVRRKDGVRVEYDRQYYVYKKVLLHHYNIGFNFITNKHNQKLIVSDELTFSNTDKHRIKNTHIVNMFCEIFNDFEVYDEKLNPAIHFNTKFDNIILPSGTLDDNDSLKDLIEIGSRFTKNEDDNNAYQKRLEVLKDFKPDIRGKGPNGFFGYIVFGFTKYDIVLLETMYAGNATYVFTTKNFENQVIQDKQTVLNNKLHLKRFFHDDNWENKLKEFMKKMENKN